MKITNLVTVFWILFFITACNDSSLSLAGGGIGGTGNPFEVGIADPSTASKVGEGINIGPITGFSHVFDSILVNSIEYDLNQAEIIMNGQAATAADLKLGMIVQVQGTITDEDNKTGTANRIEANENVVGPLQSIDKVNNQLTVLGQTVIINPFTILDGFADISELKSNNILAVSGLTNEMDHILATRIALVSPSNSFQVRGRASLDFSKQTATMGNLTVDCSQTPFAETTADEMHLLDVKGKLSGNRLIAEQCQLVEPTEWNNFATIRLEGVITRFNTATDFDIDYLPATVSPETQFQLGTVTDLALGSRLKVKGSRDENGVLVTEEIQFFNLTHYMSLKAPIETIATDSKQINLLGIPSQLNNDTVFIDKSDESTPFNWQALRIGDWVQVRGFIDLNTHLPVIEQLQRQVTQFGENVELIGHPDTIEVSSRTLNFFGITIMADNGTRYWDNRTTAGVLLNSSSLSLTASEFFTRIQTVKPLIAVEGQWFSNVMIAQQMVILPE